MSDQEATGREPSWGEPSGVVPPVQLDDRTLQAIISGVTAQLQARQGPLTPQVSALTNSLLASPSPAASQL